MVRLRAIGECVFEVGTERLGPDAEMAFALLLVVTLAQGRPLSRGQLVDLLWPATSAVRARHNLRQTLYKLRQLGVPVESQGSQVRLPLDQLAPDALLHGNPDQPPPTTLLRPDESFGEFLPGYAPELSEAFSAWLDEQRAQMHARLRRAVLTVMLDERRRGNWGAVETLARKCLQLDPLNEEATLALAEATALTGSKRAALNILDDYLAELGGAGGAVAELRLPAAVLRRRIADRLRPPTSLAVAEACFVGRGESVALLHERFREVRAGSGRALLLWGEAGIGKSRLAAEFCQLAALEGARVERVVSQARDLERPLALFMDLVPALLALPGGIGCAPESIAFLRRLTDHDAAVLEPSPATREAELLFAGVRQAILDLVDAVAHEAPLVLCVEDAHWLDGQSWRVLRELIDWIDERRVLLVLTSRQPHATASPPARPSPQLELHRLAPLVQEDALALFEAVTSGMEAPPMFRDWCVHVADGNPFFVRALAVHWIETGELRAPTSLSVLIDQRVARLTELPLRTLQACAVLGKTATFERLELVLGHARHDLVESVDRLSEHGLVAAGGSGVPCRHDLIAQAALARLADPARRLLHRCAAEVLQAEIERSQSAALLWDCAQQWLAAGESDRALTLVRSCAAHLLEVGLPAEAAEVYERALELCETDADRLEMLLHLVSSLRSAGHWQHLRDILPAIQQLRRQLQPWETSHNDEEIVLLEARWRTDDPLPLLLDAAESCGRARNAPLNHRLSATGLALVFADNLCDANAAERLFRMSEEMTMHHSSDPASLLRIRMIYHNAYGRVDAAIEAAEALIELMRVRGDAIALASALRNSTTPFRTAGLIDQAFAAAIEAYEVATQRQMASGAANAADILATLNLAVSDISHAEQWYNQARYWAGRTEEAAADISISRVGARIALLSGDGPSAQALAGLRRQALAQDQVSRRRTEGYAIFTACGLSLGRLDGAPELLEEFETALRTTMRYGGQDFAADTLLRAYLSLGDEASAAGLVRRYRAARRESWSPPEWLEAP
ncbi:MAG: ATP-binding protein [Gemmatimonadaceae bacterium]